MNRGYIAIYRKMFDHWLWNTGEELTRREAWLVILSRAAHTNTKVLIDGTLYECNRGQVLLSVKSWGQLFNWNRQKVRSFFALLEKDNMITTQGLKNTTMLTVCNYDIYNKRQPADNQQITNLQPTENQPTTNPQPTHNQPTTTINNINKVNKVNKEEKGSDHTPAVLKKQFLEFVFLTDNEYQKLVTQYGEQDTQKMIEKLNAYKGTYGKKTKSDFHAIGYWVKEWLKEEKDKESRAAKIGEKQPQIPPQIPKVEPDYSKTSFY